MYRTRVARWLLRAVVAALLLGLAFSRVPMVTVLKSLARIDVGLLLCAIVLNFAYLCILAFQMSLGLAPLQLGLTVAQLIEIGLVSSFYSLILPGGMAVGAIVSWYQVFRSSTKGIEAGMIVVFFRLVNTLTLLALGMLGMRLDTHPSIPGLGATLGILMAGVLVCLAPFVSASAASCMRQISGRIILYLPFRPQPHDGREALWTSLAAFQALGRGTLALVLGLSMVGDLVNIITWLVLAKAVRAPISALAMVWVGSLVTVIQMLPVSIGGLGTREASLVLLFKSHGIAEPKALSVSLAAFGVMVCWGSVGGLLAGWRLVRDARRAHGSACETK
jgi:uncharacterized membrane protein YbhN (UPF0104 family)